MKHAESHPQSGKHKYGAKPEIINTDLLIAEPSSALSSD